MTACNVLPLRHVWVIILCNFCIVINCVYGSAYVGTKTGPSIVKKTVYKHHLHTNKTSEKLEKNK